MTEIPHCFILGAGAPHIGDTPDSLREVRFGESVLEWQTEAFGTDWARTTFIAGYHAGKIRKCFPDLNVIENREWRETGSLYSFLCASPTATGPIFISYGDVLFRRSLIEQMQTMEGETIIAYDSLHGKVTQTEPSQQNQFTLRERVVVCDGVISRLGYDVPTGWEDGEFVGLVMVRPSMIKKLCALPRMLGRSARRMSLSEALEYLRVRGATIKAIDVVGDWVEIRQNQDIARFVLGTKAETLSRLQGVLERATIQDVVSFTVAQWQENRTPWLDLVRTQLAQKPGVRLVVRSSARNEDTFTSSNAGGYDSVLNVDPSTGLEAAIEKVILSYHAFQLDDQVLVQPMLRNVQMSGVAFTRTLEAQAPWYVINYETSGSTDGVTSGSSINHLTLYVLRGTDPKLVPAPQLQAVLHALQEIEDKLGYDSLDIEFAVDTDNCVHIFQVRPIASETSAGPETDAPYLAAIVQAKQTWNRLKTCQPSIPGDQQPMYGLMPDWNPAEIIGTAPGALAETLYRFLIMDETWAHQRSEYGYRDVRSIPLLVSFAGRPYVDVRASFASFLPASLDDDLAGRMLAFFLKWLKDRPELHDKVEFDVVLTCLAPDFDRWHDRLSTEGGFTEKEIARIRTALHDVTLGAFHRCSRDLAEIEKMERRREETNATIRDPLERARILLEDCRRFGTLPFAHLARSGFVAVTLLRGAEQIGAISTIALNAFFETVRTVSHDFTFDAQAVVSESMTFDTFASKYGHLRPGTYEILSPRYDASPDFYLRPQVDLAAKIDGVPSHSDSTNFWLAERESFLKALADIDLPSGAEQVETFLHQAIEGREYAKFIFSRSLSDAIESLAEAGAGLGLTREDLTELPLSDLMALRDKALSDVEIVAELRTKALRNRSWRFITKMLKMPPLLCSPDSLSVFQIGTEMPNFIGKKNVIAECIHLDQVESTTVPQMNGKIALILQADPGYDWLFSQGIIGLITMYGGANSHMAIRAAEFGLSAAIGVGEKRYASLATARVVNLDPGLQILRVLS